MPDYERANRTAEEFDKEHSKGEPPMRINGRMFFCDGARRDANPLGIRITTLNDEFRRRKFIVYYWELRLDLAVASFDNLKQNLMARTYAAQNQRYCYEPPDKEALDALKLLKKKVKALQLKLQEAEENREKAKPERLKRMEQFDIEAREECRDTEAELRSIEI